MEPRALDEQRLVRLLEVGRTLVSHLDLDQVLHELLEVARGLTGARYAALGVLDEERRELERFLTSGVDERTRLAIGDPPKGRGVLGVLVRDPRPLRLERFGDHPESYGLPPGHPPMDSFLGVPIVVRGEAWGNIYLTEKEGGPFGALDEHAIVALADWAAIAIGNAWLYQEAEGRRAELERAVEGLEATTAIARAVGGETDLELVLELIVKRGRALVEARSLLLLLADEGELVLSAAAGHVDPGAHGARVSIDSSVAGQVLRSGRPERVGDVAVRLGLADEPFCPVGAETALLVPLAYRRRPLGVLAVFDRMTDDPHFGPREEHLLTAFAASAATAVATAKTVEHERLRHSFRSAEQERRRWARELHDDTLQGLGSLKLMLSSGLRSGGDGLQMAVELALGQLGTDIANLRGLIAELRPAALDQFGLGPALESLCERTRAVQGLEVRLELELDVEAPLDAELETAVYRLVQEALTNVGKHAHASQVTVAVVERPDGLFEAIVSDDGQGFDVGQPAEGFGLSGMRERAALMGGETEVSSSSEGTTVRARFQVPPAGGPVATRSWSRA